MNKLKQNFYVPTGPQEPSSSWWVEVSPQAFQTRAAAELPRMLTSKFGRLEGHGGIPVTMGRAKTPRGVD